MNVLRKLPAITSFTMPRLIDTAVILEEKKSIYALSNDSVDFKKVKVDITTDRSVAKAIPSLDGYFDCTHPVQVQLKDFDGTLTTWKLYVNKFSTANLASGKTYTASHQ